MARTVYYLTTEAAIVPGTHYQDCGVVPVVLLKGNGQNLTAPLWDWNPSEVALKKISGPYHVGLWCQGPRGQTLAPWEAESSWSVILANLKRLAGLLPKGVGIVFDAEIYSATPGSNGGLMDRSAWPEGLRAELRGQQVRKAIGARPYGQYVLVSDAKKHPGWMAFGKGAFRAGDLLLDEAGYLSGAAKATAFGRQGVRNLPGRTIRESRLVGRVPPGDFWVYPWAGQDRAEVLSAVSARWKT
jgi:hypothetical protein